MRTDEFEKRLSASTAQPSRSPDDEVFIPYGGLPAHGICFTRVHIRRLVARGLFPAPVMLSPNRVAWRSSEIAAWKASRPVAPVAAVAA